MSTDVQHAGKKRRLDEVEGDGEDTDTRAVLEPAEEAPAAGAENEHREKIKKLLEHMPKETLIEVLADMGAKYQQVYDEVYRISNESEFNRKLFVHGLPYEITSDAVRRVFEDLGEVENAHVIVDKTSGKGKGYGFVTYKSADSAFLALQRTFDFDGRSVRCHLACDKPEGGSAPSKRDGAPLPPLSGPSQHGPGPRQHYGNPSVGHHAGPSPSNYGGHGGHSGGGQGGDVTLRKLFVRGLPFAVTDDLLRSVFMPYGEVEEGVIVKDRTTGKSRGFGFVTMRYVEGAQSVLLRPPRNLMDREITVTLAAAGKDGGGGGVNPSNSAAPAAGYGSNPGMMGMGGYGMMGMPMMGMGMGAYGADGSAGYPMMNPYAMGMGGGHMGGR